MRKNLIITGLIVTAAGLVIELINLRSDFKKLLEHSLKQHEVLTEIAPIIVDLQFESMIENIDEERS